MRIIVGCPIKDRSWILDKWFDHVEESILPDNVVLDFAFVLPDSDPCLDIIKNRAPNALLVLTEESSDEYIRNWGPEERYREMCLYRNVLLERVRKEAPDYFLSLDSDILLQPSAISDMIETIRETKSNAVCAPTFLDQVDKRITNSGCYGPGKRSFRRLEVGKLSTTDVIMAIKLMDIGAYNQDYEYDYRGEDFGWSQAAKRSGLKLVFAGHSEPNKHVMKKEWLDMVDKRCGY